MSYYIRVLGKQDPNIHLNQMLKDLESAGMQADLQIPDDEHVDNWTVLDVKNKSGESLVQIERNPIAEGELGMDEIEEFKEEIQDYKPDSAVKWLTKYFDRIKVIYAFQLLHASSEEDNFKIIASIKKTIWNQTGGILQADNEGFSNEDGYHILWQFSENVTGEWNCAVRNFLGGWNRFQMDLGDTIQRQEFQNGKVPKGAKRL